MSRRDSRRIMDVINIGRWHGLVHLRTENVLDRTRNSLRGNSLHNGTSRQSP